MEGPGDGAELEELRPSVCVYVPPALKRRLLEEAPEANWSQIARAAFEEFLGGTCPTCHRPLHGLGGAVPSAGSSAA